MTKYWALDYVNDKLDECELVYNGQLYESEEKAELARQSMKDPNLFEVNWYQIGDLYELYDNNNIEIDSLLKIWPDPEM